MAARGEILAKIRISDKEADDSSPEELIKMLSASYFESWASIVKVVAEQGRIPPMEQSILALYQEFVARIKPRKGPPQEEGTDERDDRGDAPRA